MKIIAAFKRLVELKKNSIDEKIKINMIEKYKNQLDLKTIWKKLQKKNCTKIINK